MATDPYALFRRSQVAAAPPEAGLRPYDLLAGVLCLFVAMTAFFAPTDPDVWWHLATGRHVATAGLPTADLFSYTAAGKPWLVQEWLTEVGMAALQGKLGYGALGAAFGLLQGLAVALVYALVRQRGAGRKLAVAAMLVYIVLAAPTWGVRPQVLTPVFFGGFLLALEAYRRSPANRGPLLVLPLAMALWANMHASFFIGAAVVAAYAVGELANRAFGRAEAAPVGPLWLTLAGCLAGTLMTPYGLGLWSYPLAYILSGTASPLLAYTQEWQPLDFHQPGTVLVTGLVLTAALAAQRRPALEWDVTGVLVGLGYTLLAVQAVRLLPLFGMAVLPLIAAGLAQVFPAYGARLEDAEAKPAGGLGWGLAGCAAFLVVGLSLGAPDAQVGPGPKADGARAYPVGAARFVDRLPSPTRLYNEFEWGGYLLATMKHHSVFIDGRADMYRERVFRDYMAIAGLEAGWRERLATYGVDTVLIRPRSPLAEALAHEPGWRSAYQDKTAVVFRREP